MGGMRAQRSLQFTLKLGNFQDEATSWTIILAQILVCSDSSSGPLKCAFYITYTAAESRSRRKSDITETTGLRHTGHAVQLEMQVRQ